MATTPYQATYSLSPKYGTRYGPSQYVAPTQNAAAPDALVYLIGNRVD